MPAIATLRPDFYRIPLPVVLTDSTHGDMKYFERLERRFENSPMLSGLLGQLKKLQSPTIPGELPLVTAGVGVAAQMADDRRPHDGLMTSDRKQGVAAGRANIRSELALECHELQPRGLADRCGAFGRRSLRYRTYCSGHRQCTERTKRGDRRSDGGVDAAWQQCRATAKVKARFAADERFRANHVRVIAENGVVYLMGLVRRQEAQDASDVARTTNGMDGKGRWVDNVFVERLWKSVKYEHVYLHAYESVTEARRQLGGYFSFYNTERPHSALGGSAPDTAYFGQLEIEKAA